MLPMSQTTTMTRIVPKGSACVEPKCHATEFSTLHTKNSGTGKIVDVRMIFHTQLAPPIRLKNPEDTYPATNDVMA